MQKLVRVPHRAEEGRTTLWEAIDSRASKIGMRCRIRHRVPSVRLEFTSPA